MHHVSLLVLLAPAPGSYLVTLVLCCGHTIAHRFVLKSTGNYLLQVLVGLSSLANVGSLAKDLLAFAEGGDGKLESSTVASPTYKLRTTVSSKQILL